MKRLIKVQGRPTRPIGKQKKTIRKKYRRLKKISFENVEYGASELRAMRLPDPIAPIDFMKIIRLPGKQNIKTEFDIELTPYLREPINCIADYSIETLILIGPTQSGKTVVIQIAIAWSIDQDPGPLLFSYPDEKTAKKMLDEKIVGMIRETDCLNKRIRSLRDVSRSGIRLDTMTIFPAWSNSIPTYSSSPKKRVVSDEVRLFNLTSGKESNALKLADDRLTTYRSLGLGQHIMVSSPSTEGDLLHQQLSIPGTTVLRWHVPCPNCGVYQLLDFFSNVKKPDKGGSVKCRCRFCEAEFPDVDMKKSWNNNGCYAPEGHVISRDNAYHGGIVKDINKTRRMVFWWDSLVSPFRTFRNIWNEFVDTKDKPHDYINFTQGWLARFNRQGKSKTTIDKLKTHKRDYDKGEVPQKVKVLIAGIDTQDDALYYVVYGFGFKNETWLIDEGVIPCDIDTTNVDDLESLVIGNIINKSYVGKETDETWKIAFGAWDAGGHRTKEIQAVVKRLRGKIVAIHGRAHQMRSVIFSKHETHYNIRSSEYLVETENIAAKENDFHLPKNVSYEFMVHFVNKKKIKEVDRNGRVKWSWQASGADHLRMASAYAFACLDMPIGRKGDLRSRLREHDFKLNPSRQTVQPHGAKPARTAGKKQEMIDDAFARHERVMRAREKETFSW